MCINVAQSSIKYDRQPQSDQSSKTQMAKKRLKLPHRPGKLKMPSSTRAAGTQTLQLRT